MIFLSLHVMHRIIQWHFQELFYHQIYVFKFIFILFAVVFRLFFENFINEKRYHTEVDNWTSIWLLLRDYSRQKIIQSCFNGFLNFKNFFDNFLIKRIMRSITSFQKSSTTTLSPSNLTDLFSINRLISSASIQL